MNSLLTVAGSDFNKLHLSKAYLSKSTLVENLPLRIDGPKLQFIFVLQASYEERNCALIAISTLEAHVRRNLIVQS
jgi:hypothetical protein